MRGGLDVLFEDQKEIDVEFDSDSDVANVQDLIIYMKQHLLKGEEELFLQAKTMYSFIFISLIIIMHYYSIEGLVFLSL